jgi:hypothetical protein
MRRHPKFPKHVRPTNPICLQDWKSQRLHGLLREFLTSRSLRREHWPGGTLCKGGSYEQFSGGLEQNE